MSRAAIPREVSKWFDKLDLTYSVRNLTRDLANGFVVAEIISRHIADVDIYQFYNGLDIEKRKNNWSRIAEILKSDKHKDKDKKETNKYGPLNITNLDYEPVIFLKKGAALDMIIRLPFLTLGSMSIFIRRASWRSTIQ